MPEGATRTAVGADLDRRRAWIPGSAARPRDDAV